MWGSFRLAPNIRTLIINAKGLVLIIESVDSIIDRVGRLYTGADTGGGLWGL